MASVDELDGATSSNVVRTGASDDTDLRNLFEVSALTSRSRVQAKSRGTYDSKLKYIIKFMEDKYPEQVQVSSSGVKELKLPLSFASIEALFAKLMIDTDLPRDSRKRKQLEANRREELMRVREAALARGLGEDDEDVPDIPAIEEDMTINKANSITVSKSCLGGYKSALKLYYSDRKIAFECPERERGSQTIDQFLDEQIKCYANLIAEKKLRAVMPLTEGKASMTEEGFMRIIEKMIEFKPRVRLRRGRV
jgi:hypothetical protein